MLLSLKQERSRSYMGEDKREIKKEITEEILSILKNGSSRV